MWHNANPLRDLIVELCALHNFNYRAGDGSQLELTSISSLMPLVVLAYSPHTVAVNHYHTVNGDHVLDPEIVFYIKPLPAEPNPDKWDWFPLTFEQTGEMYEVIFELDRSGQPKPMTRSDSIRQFRLAIFANGLWMKNLRSSGYTLLSE